MSDPRTDEPTADPTADLDEPGLDKGTGDPNADRAFLNDMPPAQVSEDLGEIDTDATDADS